MANATPRTIGETLSDSERRRCSSLERLLPNARLFDRITRVTHRLASELAGARKFLHDVA
jgi:hypothetical protein